MRRTLAVGSVLVSGAGHGVLPHTISSSVGAAGAIVVPSADTRRSTDARNGIVELFANGRVRGRRQNRPAPIESCGPITVDAMFHATIWIPVVDAAHILTAHAVACCIAPGAVVITSGFTTQLFFFPSRVLCFHSQVIITDLLQQHNISSPLCVLVGWCVW